MAAENTSDILKVRAVVSPLRLGGEEKNQDRICWFESGLTACVCDGVSASPYGAEAAELVARSSPILFKADIRDRLRVLADLLIVRRIEALQRPVQPPADVPEPMRKILREVTQEKMASSYQTTLVAAHWVISDDHVLTTVVHCGDSAFFAFSGQGDFLASTLPAHPANGDLQQDKSGDEVAVSSGIRFGPGDEILVRIMGQASDQPLLAQAAGISVASLDRWLVCAALDSCVDRAQEPTSHVADPRSVRLSIGDILLVPKYLTPTPKDPGYRGYRRLMFSPAIRTISGGTPRKIEPTWEGRGSATAVLPDHFHKGCWGILRDRFPCDVHFVLASDGFYSCFRNPAELWDWLRKNERRLGDTTLQDKAMEELHARLHARQGDDDMSFVWVYPQDRVDSTAGMPSKESQEKDDHVG